MFFQSLVSQASEPRFSVLEKELPKILPRALQNFTSSDIMTMAEEFDAERKSHEENHPGSIEECPVHRTLVALSKQLRESARLHLQ
jgi:hypothetical protein